MTTILTTCPHTFGCLLLHSETFGENAEKPILDLGKKGADDGTGFPEAPMKINEFCLF